MIHIKHFMLFTSLIFSLFNCKGPSQKAERHKVLYINSYHKGYAPSDAVLAGITETLCDSLCDLRVFYMDTKRDNSQQNIEKKVSVLIQIMEKFKPEVVIASDDNAVKHFVVPHLKNTETPVVFCGVNWSAKQYGLPTENITGMLEVLPLRTLLTRIKQPYPEAKKMVVLSENSTSEQNNKILLDTLYRNLGFEVEYSLVDDFSSWKEEFKKANQHADLIYMPTNGSIKNWDEDVAVRFVLEETKIPTLTCDDFMMEYCVYGLTKVPKEQGIWAAQTAGEILKGLDVAVIPVTKNIDSQTWLNKSLADKMAFKLEPTDADIVEMP